MLHQKFISITSLAFKQEDRMLFTFAVEGTKLKDFATVSRLSRQEDKTILGYQRPEVISHIDSIKKYLLSESPMLPNAIVLAFDDVIDFIPLIAGTSQAVQPGILKIPIDPTNPEFRKPAWIVDGQQRSAALQEVAKNNFHVCVVGFIANNPSEQREQFMLVNTTKPLAKGLLYELLPHTNCLLPGIFEKRRFPAYLLERLNFDEKSPLYKKIKTTTNQEGIIQDNSILKMLENSLADGALYFVQESSDCKTEEEITDLMLEILHNFWSAVCSTFTTAWSLPPKKSRLTHGAGIISLGFIMDAIVDRNSGNAELDSLDIDIFKADLEKLIPVCRWTYGYWEFGPGAQRKWNEIQNTPTDIRILAHYLLIQYKSLVWNDAIRYQ